MSFVWLALVIYKVLIIEIKARSIIKNFNILYFHEGSNFVPSLFDKSALVHMYVFHFCDITLLLLF